MSSGDNKVSNYVALEDELTIGKVVADLCEHLGKTEAQVLNILATIIEDAELGNNKIQLFAKHNHPTRSWSTEHGMEVDAVVKRRPRIQAAILSNRLREAARGGISSARAISLDSVDNSPPSVTIDSIFIGRRDLVRAIQAAEWSTPESWIGKSRASVLAPSIDDAMTRAAIVKSFPALNPNQWKRQFDRNNALKSCLLGTKSGHFLLYSQRKVERWLIENGLYTEAEIRALAGGAGPVSQGRVTSMNPFPKPRVHRMK